jgi:hypothetical protein
MKVLDIIRNPMNDNSGNGGNGGDGIEKDFPKIQSYTNVIENDDNETHIGYVKNLKINDLLDKKLEKYYIRYEDGVVSASILFKDMMNDKEQIWKTETNLHSYQSYIPVTLSATYYDREIIFEMDFISGKSRIEGCRLFACLDARFVVIEVNYDYAKDEYWDWLYTKSHYLKKN